MNFAPAIEIRTAVCDDAGAVAGCLAAAFASYKTAYSPSAFADTVASEQGVRLRIQQAHVLVAITCGNVVGTISARIRGNHGHLRGMAVLPEFRGTGLAADLLTAIETWLRARGCAEVTLDTTEPLMAAMRFYENHGYHRSGKIADFFGMPLIEYVKPLR